MLPRALTPLAARAKITGKYSGLAPAITALTATFSTVYAHASRVEVGRICPTTSSGRRLVPASIAATRSCVGRMIGRRSVHWLSKNSWCRLSSVSGSTHRGVERSKRPAVCSSRLSGRVSAAMTSSITG